MEQVHFHRDCCGSSATAHWHSATQETSVGPGGTHGFIYEILSEVETGCGIVGLTPRAFVINAKRVVTCRLFDQNDLFLWDLWSSAFVPVIPSPIQFETWLVPLDDGCRLDDKQCILPPVVEILHKAEEESIEMSQSWSR